MFKEYLASFLFWNLKISSQILPKKIKYSIAQGIAWIFYKYHKRYYKIAKANLDFIYKESISNEKKEQIIKDMFLNLAQNLGSFIENQDTSKEKILKKVTFKNDNILLNALKSNKPIVFITAHQSNWEILPLAIAAKYQPLTGVGRPLDQVWLDKILQKNREQFNIEMISKFGAMRKMVKTVKAKRVLGLLVDQNLEGVEVEFFGKKTIHTTSAAILATKFNATVIPAFITRVGFEKYIATFYDPIEIEKSGDEAQDIINHTQKQAAITEKVIRESPHEWLWIHRRWKQTYPEIYNV
jgi:KDO2-lipid IV(A) lauroyltransferase